jgi:hypothetical protein
MELELIKEACQRLSKLKESYAQIKLQMKCEEKTIRKYKMMLQNQYLYLVRQHLCNVDIVDIIMEYIAVKYCLDHATYFPFISNCFLCWSEYTIDFDFLEQMVDISKFANNHYSSKKNIFLS